MQWNVRFGPNHRGWWSDNLQNKDNTVLAGQTSFNRYSVNSTDLTKGLWIPIEQLQGEGAGAGALKASHNIYTCLYNRHRIRVAADGQVLGYAKNVYINNVVPIEPRLRRNDPHLTKYECDFSKPQYFPHNISQINNRVTTNSARDWLYFAANLRGGARENINLLLHIEPFADVFYEGAAKVFDGGRFVYWYHTMMEREKYGNECMDCCFVNERTEPDTVFTYVVLSPLLLYCNRNPANGPNSFLVVDNSAQMVHAKRTDLEVQNRPLPHQVTTINAEFYHIIAVQDKAEINREFRGNAYYNFFGFGDAAVHVYGNLGHVI